MSNDILDTPVEYAIWDGGDLDAETLAQMDRACRLPVAVRGAQMADGHVGYGLPIGGVLACDNAVIPYGVGVDIGCRVKLSILPQPASRLAGWRDSLKKALQTETRFGIGAEFRGNDRRDHAVMEDEAWQNLPRPLRGLRDKAWAQLGSSGSGNHFVEWGELHLPQANLGLEPGKYLALMSHSGSRGLGANIADHFTKLAMQERALPKEFRHLAWLDLNDEAGASYWNAMNLAGDYAAANHDLIHRTVLRAAGLQPAVQVENHHNFAWLEQHDGKQLVVHRKGATPAGVGELGVIPGTMADPTYVVRGLGEPRSLNSASHGAGRRLSRKRAKETITRSEIKKYLADRDVELLAAGVDEAPMAYKDIDKVMATQADLVQPIASFLPKIVLMASDGRSED